MASSLKSYRDLVAWQKAMNLMIEVYRLCKKFPSEELYVLSAQLRRASLSVPSNIAEGYGRASLSDYIRFLKIAAGSLFEAETQIEAARRLGFISSAEFQEIEEQTLEVERILCALIQSLERKQKN